MAVVVYSPGLLGWYPNNDSLFIAGLSIIIGIALVALFICVNLKCITSESKQPVKAEDVDGLAGARKILTEYKNSRYLGGAAKTAESQIERVAQIQEKLISMINNRFSPGSMTWNRYMGIVKSADSALIFNIVNMANRMRIFDDKDYKRLENYKEDNIPDDIQEKQIALYNKNIEEVNGIIKLNENILYNLNALAMEITGMNNDENSGVNDELVGELENLIAQTKLYE